MKRAGCKDGYHKVDGRCKKTFYHVTTKKRLPNILKKGLLVSHPKSVRISKKNVNYVMKASLHAGFFASEMAWNAEEDVVILHLDIDKNKLKQDRNIGAIIGSWYEYHDNIKPNQIFKVEPWDQKAKKKHMQRMETLFK